MQPMTTVKKAAETVVHKGHKAADSITEGARHLEVRGRGGNDWPLASGGLAVQCHACAAQHCVTSANMPSSLCGGWVIIASWSHDLQAARASRTDMCAFTYRMQLCATAEKGGECTPLRRRPPDPRGHRRRRPSRQEDCREQGRGGAAPAPVERAPGPCIAAHAVNLNEQQDVMLMQQL
jgi:hypothetical protein